MVSFYDQLIEGIDGYILVEDAEEELCELYSVYYSKDSNDRLDLVEPRKPEVDIEIEGGKRPISLTISQNININGEPGQTGAVLWNSSIVMGEFFARSTPHWDLSALTALELGSGCGLVGLTLHRLGMQQTILTDQLRMMRLLTKNMDANRLKSSSLEMFATEYVWGQMPEDQRIVRQSIDMVVASDCVYHESVAPMLVHTLVDVCKSRVDGKKCVGMVGQELRSDLVHQVFLAELLKHFVVYRVPVSPKIDGFYALYAIWLK